MVTASDQQLDALFKRAVDLGEAMREDIEKSHDMRQQTANLLEDVASELPKHRAEQLLELRARLDEAA